jgi:serpin B
MNKTISRRKILILAALLLVVAGAGAAVAWWQWYRKGTPPIVLRDERNGKGGNLGTADFALKIHREIAADNQGNSAFSPYLLSEQLTLACTAAKGETASQIATLLGLSNPPKVSASAVSKFRDRVRKSAGSGSCTFTEAQCAWFDLSCKLRTKWMSLAQEAFEAGVETADFKGDPAGAAGAINAWVAEKTQGLFPRVMDPASVSTETRMLLAGVVHFKGKWKDEFPLEGTEPWPFHLLSGSRNLVQTMSLYYHHFPYSKTKDLSVIELPYRDSTVAMDILLPAKRDGLPAMEAGLTADRLAELLAGMKSVEIDIYIPRFSFKVDLSFSKALQDLGVRDAFQEDADFHAAVEEGAPVFLQDVMQSTEIHVTEEGTEATSSGRLVGIANGEAHPMFIADHPFMFLIRDTSTGAVLFIGRVTEP